MMALKVFKIKLKANQCRQQKLQKCKQKHQNHYFDNGDFLQNIAKTKFQNFAKE